MFLHNFLPKIELTRIDSPNGRKYLTPEGNSYMSVTTFLGQQSKESIDEWRKAVGEEEANRKSKQATDRGTALHHAIEQMLMNEENVIITNYFAKNIYKSFSKKIKEKVNNIRALEYPLYSDVMKLAGSLDLFADWDNVPSIIDFKTATKFKDKYEIESYFLQTSIYSYMIEERYKIKVPQLVIVIGVEFSNDVQIFVENRNNFKEKIITLLKERNDKNSKN